MHLLLIQVVNNGSFWKNLKEMSAVKTKFWRSREGLKFSIGIRRPGSTSASAKYQLPVTEIVICF